VPEVADKLHPPAREYAVRRQSIHAEPDRLVTTQEAAIFCGFSCSHWRTMWKSGKAPQPLKLSERKYGWRLSDLRRWIDSKAAA
jgi:predicted DNA-binding transcriptional regulator AlpA